MGPIAFWGYSQGGGAAASAAELASSYAPELKVVGTYAGAPPADLKELFPYADGSVLVGAVGYALNSVMTAYPEHADAIRSKLTPRGEDLLFKVADQCVAETIAKFMFRHLQPYFNEDINQLVNEEPFSQPVRRAEARPLQTQCARDDFEQSVRPVGAVDRLPTNSAATGAHRVPTFSSGPTRNRRSSTRRSSTTHCRCSSTASGPCSGSPTDSTDYRPRRTAASSRASEAAAQAAGYGAAVLDVRQRLPDAGRSAFVCGCVFMYAATFGFAWSRVSPSRLLKKLFTSG